MVPDRPNNIPIAFLFFICSFIIKEDKIKTIIGVVTIKTAPIIGEV